MALTKDFFSASPSCLLAVSKNVNLMRILFFPCLIVIGWMASRANSERMRKMARVLLGILFGFVPVLAVSGVQQDGQRLGEIHRFSAHLFVIVAWLAIPVILGTLLQRSYRESLLLATVHTTAMLGLLLFVFLNSFTGYLGPSFQDSHKPHYEEEHNRFLVLHQILFPSLLAMLIVSEWWSLRPRVLRATSSAETGPVSMGQTCDPSNPYHPPSKEREHHE